VSRGHGAIQQYLDRLLMAAPKPLTFAEIVAIAYPEGGFEGDMAKVLGSSNVGAVRSLRRALKRLADDGMIIRSGGGRRGNPHRYWRNLMIPWMAHTRYQSASICWKHAASCRTTPS
jgi:hypothetical protein